MTTIPGHNIIIQQSGSAQERLHHANTSKSSPEHIAAQQETKEILKNTTVQGFDESEKLRAKKEKEALQRRKEQKKKKQTKITKEMVKEENREKKKNDSDQNPNASGRLLDTMV